MSPGNSGSERRFPRSYDALSEIFEFTGAFFAEQAIEADHLAPVNLAVEELFTNLVKYNKTGVHEISIRLERSGDRLSVSLSDFDVDPFDVTRIEPPQVDAPLDRRVPGGLGLHLVKRMVDQLVYEYNDRTSTTTFVKIVE